MTAETNSLSPALVLARALASAWPCQYQLVEPVRRFGEVEEIPGNTILPGHVLGRPVANTNGRCHDDVTAFTAHIDIGLCQSAGAVGHGPGRVPFKHDMLPAARRYLGVRCW